MQTIWPERCLCSRAFSTQRAQGLSVVFYFLLNAIRPTSGRLPSLVESKVVERLWPVCRYRTHLSVQIDDKGPVSCIRVQDTTLDLAICELCLFGLDARFRFLESGRLVEIWVSCCQCNRPNCGQCGT